MNNKSSVMFRLWNAPRTSVNKSDLSTSVRTPSAQIECAGSQANGVTLSNWALTAAKHLRFKMKIYKTNISTFDSANGFSKAKGRWPERKFAVWFRTILEELERNMFLIGFVNE